MKICYESDICLPQHVPSLLGLVHQHYDDLVFEDNPWIVRAAALAHLLGGQR